MKIAVYGPGGIGSTFAYQLARAGHEVTVVARGKRLEQLTREGAIVRASGERAPVAVSAALDASTEWDLVLATVLASQVEAILPALAQSSAKTVMFMFNTFESLGRLRDAVGPARFAFGFPAILATLEDGRLTSEIVTRGMLTTVTDARWAKVFGEAGIPCDVHADMESWLRTHAAFVVPFMVGVGNAYARKSGCTWAEAMRLAQAMQEGFRLVHHLGNAITPAPMAALSRAPAAMLAGLIWSATRVESVRKTGGAGFGEPRALIDAMSAAAPGQTPLLQAIRP